MARNTPRSQNGRSAIARKAIFSATGSTNGMYTNTDNGGGMRKGGAQPSGTGFMIRETTHDCSSSFERQLFVQLDAIY
jgi:hypothetical protein